jgi:hypothetical protein
MKRQGTTVTARLDTRAARCEWTRMMRATAIVLPALIVAMITGCEPRVGGERSTIATFPRYRTYAWAGPAAPALAPSESGAALLDWRIHAAIDRALAARGYERTSGTASLLVDYDVVTPAGDESRRHSLAVRISSPG